MLSMLGRLSDRLLIRVVPHAEAAAAVGFCYKETLMCPGVSWCNSYVKQGCYRQVCCRDGSCKLYTKRCGCYCVA